MQRPLAVNPNKLRALVSAAAVAGLAGCAPPLVLDPPPAPARLAAVQADSLGAPPTVQLRYYWFSPDVGVVTWAPDEPYGLRSIVRRNGSLVGDHRIFVSSYHDPGMPIAGKALMDTRRLLVTGMSRDIDRCRFGACSPSLFFGALIPDEVLRASRDSVSVKFYGRAGREMVVTLRPDVVAAYLEAVDSVSTALRRGRF